MSRKPKAPEPRDLAKQLILDRLSKFENGTVTPSPEDWTWIISAYKAFSDEAPPAQDNPLSKMSNEKLMQLANGKKS